MKKQIIATAVAVSFALPAMADIALNGGGSYKYVYTKDGINNTSSNTGLAEANVTVKGVSGDSAVMATLDFDAANSSASAVDVEDFYMTTNLGPVNVKAGNFGGSGSDLLGEIDNGAREHGRVHLSMDPMDGVTIYGGNGANGGVYNNNAYVGVVANLLEGWKFEAAKNNEDKNSFGAVGTVGPLGIRAEVADSDVPAENGHFYHLTGNFDNISVGYAMIDMDANGSATGSASGGPIGITEDDSGLFAVSNNSEGNSNAQFDVSMNFDGTTFGAKVGSIGFEGGTEPDIDYTKLSVGRGLPSGANLDASYKTVEQQNKQDDEIFEVKLSISF